jgi:hypothetical protein
VSYAPVSAEQHEASGVPVQPAVEGKRAVLLVCGQAKEDGPTAAAAAAAAAASVMIGCLAHRPCGLVEEEQAVEDGGGVHLDAVQRDSLRAAEQDLVRFVQHCYAAHGDAPSRDEDGGLLERQLVAKFLDRLRENGL